MTMMMARFWFFDYEAEECIADLKSYGFTVLSHVFPDEPDCVCVEASRNIEESGTLFELSSRMHTVLCEIMPGGVLTDVGPLPAGHKPFHYEDPEWW